MTVLVNGVAIAQTVFPPASAGTTEAGSKTRYTLDVRTEDQRSQLAADGVDVLWVYGKVSCNKPKVDTARLTRSISFNSSGANSDWLKLGTSKMSGGFKAIPVRAEPPSPLAVLADGGTFVVVSASIKGKSFNAPVPIELEGEYDYEFV